MPPLIEKYNKDNNKSLAIEDFTEYDFSHIVEMPTSDFFNKYADEKFFMNLKPYKSMVEFINDCNNNNDNIYFVTSCSPHTASWRYNKLKQIFSWITKENFIICSHKWLINYDILIDDNIDNFRREDKINILVNRPWNINKIGLVDNIDRITIEGVME